MKTTTVLFIIVSIFVSGFSVSTFGGSSEEFDKAMNKISKTTEVLGDIYEEKRKEEDHGQDMKDQAQRRAERIERQRQRSADQRQRRILRDREMVLREDQTYHRIGLETRRMDLQEYLQLDENDRRNARLNSELATEDQLRRIADLKAETGALRDLAHNSNPQQALILREQIREKEREITEIRSPQLFEAGESQQEFQRQYRGSSSNSGSTQSSRRAPLAGE